MTLYETEIICLAVSELRWADIKAIVMSKGYKVKGTKMFLTALVTLLLLNDSLLAWLIVVDGCRVLYN